MPKLATNKWGLRPPKPMSAPNTGDAKLDEAIAAARMYKATPKQEKLIEKAGARLVPLLDDDALDMGVIEVSEQAKSKLGSHKGAYTKVSWELRREQQIRERYVRTLMFVLAEIPEGGERLVAIAAGKYPGQVRWIAAWAMVSTGDRAALAAVAEAVHPKRWDGIDEDEERVYREGADAWFRLGSAVAFDELAPLVSAEHLATPGGLARARCIVHCVQVHKRSDYNSDDKSIKHAPIDPRWAPVIVPLVGDPAVDFVVTFALLALPPEPAALAPFLTSLGTSPAKVKYIAETNTRLLAHLATPETPEVVPWLIRALNPDAATPALEGLRKAKNPSAVPAIQAWAKKAKKPAQKALANKVAAELAKLG